MPVDLLEPPTEVEAQAPRVRKPHVPENARKNQHIKTRDLSQSGTREWLQKVFAGHEEFLGYTPD